MPTDPTYQITCPCPRKKEFLFTPKTKEKGASNTHSASSLEIPCEYCDELIHLKLDRPIEEGDNLYRGH